MQKIPKLEFEGLNNKINDDRIKNLLIKLENDGYKEETKILEKWANEKKINGRTTELI